MIGAPAARGCRDPRLDPLVASSSMTADEYLEAFAAEVGVAAPSPAEFEALLELASLAAHGSERLAAPLACWMAGASGRPVAELLAVARRIAPEAA